VKVEIWSDVVCPWCYVGKRRFEDALAGFEHRDQVEVIWRSFQLDPSGHPKPGDGDLVDRLARKYGVSRAQAQAMNDRVTGVANSVGLDMRLDKAVPANTFDAHRLIHLGAAHGLQHETKERLLRAYFIEGENVADPATLRRLGLEVGLPIDEVEALLADPDLYAAEVRTDAAEAGMLGANGVPFFVIDRRYGISGAQETALFTQALKQAWTEANPLTVLGAQSEDAAAADGCADGVCAV
jgi:predicted DsbA family dithiol-disulfide isomerase